MSYTIIIPARYASTRFPGKPLAMLGDKIMLQHTYERAMQSTASQVIIATDDERIRDAATSFGAEVCMTSTDHASGTDRLAEVVEKMQFDDDTVIVNLQGDEPFIAVDSLEQAARLLLDSPGYGMATLGHEMDDVNEINNPNIVKMVMDINGDALYFSRAPIPWDRDGQRATPYYRHVGMYAYTAKFLREYIQMAPCDLEQTEALEQLRVMYHGIKIKVGISKDKSTIGIDTPEGLKKAEALLKK